MKLYAKCVSNKDLEIDKEKYKILRKWDIIITEEICSEA
jgi:hypothetical protein